MFKMVDGTGIIGVDMVCPLGGAVSPPQPPNYDNVEMEGVGSLMLPNSLKAPLERLELIGNSTQGENPAPDNPQEIKNAGRKSKNLFNIADLRVGQVQKDGTINEKSTHSRTAILDVPEDGKYRIAFNSNDDYTMLYFAEMYTNGVYSQPYVRVRAGNSNSLISLKKGKNILSFNTYNNNTQVDFPKDHNIMIAAESETLDYEPYGYLLDVKVTGKNLFNKELIKKAMQGVSYLYVPIYVKKGSKVSFSYSKTLPSGLNFYVLLARDMGASYGSCSWLYHSTATSLCNNEGTFVADNDVISLSFFGSDLDIMIENLFNYLQIEISDKPTPYEPYTEQTVQIALDEPLRGVGEYKDVLTKDGVVRKIKRIVFDGSEDEKWGIGIERENVIDFVSTQFSDATKINEHQRSMMDKLKWSSGVWGRDEIGQDMFAGILRINMPKTLTPDLQTFKTWLSQNPLTVDYVLAEPVTEPLPESVQAQLAALYSENGTTHVFVDSGKVEAGIKLTYRKEK